MKETLIQHLKIHFNYSFDMLEKMIEACPDNLWNQKHGGFIFWQQLLHAFIGNKYWTRLNELEFMEPFSERNVYPDLDKEPEGEIAKNEMQNLANEIRKQNETYFSGKYDDWLMEKSSVLSTIANIDIIEMQIRHIQYHVGHCNCILRENNVKAVEWIDYLG